MGADATQLFNGLTRAESAIAQFAAKAAADFSGLFSKAAVTLPDAKTAGIDKGTGSVARLATTAARTGSTVLKLGAAMTGVGAGFALRGAIDTAIRTEKAMGLLGKAADLDAAGLARMKSQIEGLATSLHGVKLDDLISIATTGAKMGIAGDELVRYTEGVAKVSIAIDDIPATELADQIGKVNSVFRLGVGGTEQLGSAIDKLADSGVSSASGILAVTQRLSGTAAAMHLGAAETTALSAALLDTGTHSELAASAINALLTNMLNVEGQQGMAATIGLPFEEFAAMVQTRPIAAVQAFLESLRQLEAGAQIKSLGEAGIKGEQQAAEVMKLAQQTDSLAKYIGLANSEFDTLNQLNASYAASAELTNSKIVDAQNLFQILSDKLGVALLPALNVALEAFNSFATTGVQVFGGSLVNIGLEVEALMKNFGLFGEWFADNWVNLITDGIMLAANVVFQGIKGIGDNIAELWRGLASGMWDFDFKMPDLTEGFTRKSAEMPKFFKANLVTMEDMANTSAEKIAATTGTTPAATGGPSVADALAASKVPDKVGEIAAGAVDSALAPLLGREDWSMAGKAFEQGKGPLLSTWDQGAFGEDIGQGKGEKKKDLAVNAAVTLGSTEAGSAIAKYYNQGSTASDKPIKDVARTARDQLGEARKQTTTLEAILARTGTALSAYTI